MIALVDHDIIILKILSFFRKIKQIYTHDSTFSQLYYNS